MRLLRVWRWDEQGGPRFGARALRMVVGKEHGEEELRGLSIRSNVLALHLH